MSSYAVLIGIPSGSRAGITGAFPKAASAGPRASRVVWLFAPRSKLPTASKGTMCFYTE